MKPQFWQIPTPNDATLLRLPEKTAQLILRLQDIVSQHQNIKFASSLAVEDMVITDVIARQCLPITVFTLQTGRLNAETLQLIDQVKQNYSELNFEIYEPKAQAVAQYVQNHGENAFYDSVALRRECCHIRKIEPLNRALDEADAWLTGQRREQSVTRYELPLTEHDNTRNITKYTPIADWSE
ncbi:MAG: phosphoadenylyl-sulfate reductase, partial [Kingella sp. (in: b-proteobacteria)]